MIIQNKKKKKSKKINSSIGYSVALIGLSVVIFYLNNQEKTTVTSNLDVINISNNESSKDDTNKESIISTTTIISISKPLTGEVILSESHKNLDISAIVLNNESNDHDTNTDTNLIDLKQLLSELILQIDTNQSDVFLTQLEDISSSKKMNKNKQQKARLNNYTDFRKAKIQRINKHSHNRNNIKFINVIEKQYNFTELFEKQMDLITLDSAKLTQITKQMNKLFEPQNFSIKEQECGKLIKTLALQKLIKDNNKKISFVFCCPEINVNIHENVNENTIGYAIQQIMKNEKNKCAVTEILTYLMSYDHEDSSDEFVIFSFQESDSWFRPEEKEVSVQNPFKNVKKGVK